MAAAILEELAAAPSAGISQAPLSSLPASAADRALAAIAAAVGAMVLVEVAGVDMAAIVATVAEADEGQYELYKLLSDTGIRNTNESSLICDRL
jgi:hypothetical protein